MAYGLKYEHRYCDRFGVEYSVGVYERDYVGAVEQVEAGTDPFSVALDGTEDRKTGAVLPTKGTLRLFSSPTFNMEELYTTDDQKYKVVNKRTNGSKKGYWEGFVIPNGFSEELDNHYHVMEIQASDRLPALQAMKFTVEEGDNYGVADGVFRRSWLWILKECLLKTGLELPFRSMIDLKLFLAGEEEQGGVFSREVAFYNEAQDGRDSILFVDPFEIVGPTLTVGSIIRVRGGVNDGSSFVVDSWDYAGTGPMRRLSIYPTTSPISTYPNMESVILEFTTPVPGGGGEYPDPLTQAEIDVRTYIDKKSQTTDTGTKNVKAKPYYEFVDGTKMTWEVLRDFAATWNVRIFQNNGFWEIRRVNVEALPAGTYSWFEYSKDGVFSGRTSFGQDVVFPCEPTEDVHRPFGHTIYMDRVLKRVTVRYNYRYKEEGDSVSNMIYDGNFQLLGGTENRWMIQQEDSYAGFPPMLAAKEEADLPPGITSGLRLSGFMASRSITNSTEGYRAEVVKGNKLKLTLHEKITGDAEDLCGVYSITLVKTVIGNRGAVNISETKIFDLVNSSGMRRSSPRDTGLSEAYNIDGAWEERDYKAEEKLVDKLKFITPYTKVGGGVWRTIEINMPDAPEGGTLIVEIVGVATLNPTSTDKRHPLTLQNSDLNAVQAFVPKKQQNVRGQEAEYLFEKEELRLVSFRSAPNQLLVTGMFIPRYAEGDERGPDYIGYIYEQEGEYSDTLEDIDVLTMDGDFPDYVGTITGIGGIMIDKWDTWAQEFTWDTLGKILAKSVMQLYAVPTRVIDGAFVRADLDFGTRFFLEETNGAKFIVTRGELNFKKAEFRGTISQVGTSEIPLDLDKQPNWQRNGITRCQKEIESGINTGKLEVQEVDTNPRSPTFGQSRWVVTNDDATECPAGMPPPFYWGASDLPVDLDLFSIDPISAEGDLYTLLFDNDDTGKYLMVYIWEGLGDLEEIRDIENERTMQNWEAMADRNINGFNYKGFRMKYKTGIFVGHPKTFEVS